jgi:PAS domain S-box-containing protein
MNRSESDAAPHTQTPVLFHALDRDGRLVRVSRQWLERLGYRREEVIGRPFWDFLTDTSRRYAIDTVLPHYHASGFSTEVPLQIVTASGKIVDVLFSASADFDDRGEITGYLAAMTDVTERLAAEKALRESWEIFFRAFRASGAVLIISSEAEGRFIEVNEAFERVIGYRRDEVIGRMSLQLNIWADPQDRAGYLGLLNEQGKVRDLEVRLRSKSGSGVAGLLSGELVELGGEKCLVSIINDITDRKRASEEIEVLHTELASHALALELANEELEAFSYTVSHDLRKPLTVISGYCQILLDDADCQGAECQRLLNGALNGTVRMSELIATLLAFSRLKHGELDKAPVDLSEVASDAAEEVTAADPQRQAQLVIGKGLVAEGDGALLRVVLDNLIGNAWKYTAGKDDAVIEFGCREIAGTRGYFVRDNGIGFDSATGSHSLFKPFHRQPGAERFGGLGIGLATVKRIIQRHGGTVWAEGEPGRGACFYFTLG